MRNKLAAFEGQRPTGLNRAYREMKEQEERSAVGHGVMGRQGEDTVDIVHKWTLL